MTTLASDIGRIQDRSQMASTGSDSHLSLQPYITAVRKWLPLLVVRAAIQAEISQRYVLVFWGEEKREMSRKDGLTTLRKQTGSPGHHVPSRLHLHGNHVLRQHLGSVQRRGPPHFEQPSRHVTIRHRPQARRLERRSALDQRIHLHRDVLSHELLNLHWFSHALCAGRSRTRPEIPAQDVVRRRARLRGDRDQFGRTSSVGQRSQRRGQDLQLSHLAFRRSHVHCVGRHRHHAPPLPPRLAPPGSYRR